MITRGHPTELIVDTLWAPIRGGRPLQMSSAPRGEGAEKQIEQPCRDQRILTTRTMSAKSMRPLTVFSQADTGSFSTSRAITNHEKIAVERDVVEVAIPGGSNDP